MSTSINLDDNLIQECRRLSNLKTKKEIIHSALKEYVKLLKRRKILEYEGKVEWDGDGRRN